MMKIFKLIVIVLLATVMGVWASKYHGYIMIVLADKAIKINLVAFVFAALIILFLAVFSFRVLKIVFGFPYQLFSWFIGLFIINKQEKFADIVADISLENNKLLKKTSVSNILKLSPKYLKEYILFRKLYVLADNKDVKEIDKALNQISSETSVHKFFDVYKLYLMQKYTQAQANISLLLEKNDSRFLPNIVNLAGKIALADKNDTFALKLLEKYDAYLKSDIEEKLIILSLEEAEDLSKLSDIYNKADATEKLTEIYIQQLIDRDETILAEKVAKKQFAEGKVSSEMLKLYVNAFSIPVSKLYDKVLNSKDQNLDSILTLLDLAMLKSDNHTFKMIYDYVEKNKDILSDNNIEKYTHILCKFYIKNGNVNGLDLSEARLVYKRS